eukprot:gb/GEZN01005624.1/.p1 GENE.gb/GEZN01005624.1/~~gb/GEZN01005624.1/.p1  ORF type:complete len:481 (+),score=22.44 gb/GEZN01005624.1/:74-1516(+)
MSGMDYEALNDGYHDASLLHPARTIAGIVGVVLLGTAGWIASKASCISSKGVLLMSGCENCSPSGCAPGDSVRVPFYPEFGIDEVLVKPGAPGPLELAPTGFFRRKPKEPSALFLYSGKIPTPLTTGVISYVTWAYGIKPNASGSLCYATGDDKDIVKGKLLVWPAVGFRDRLEVADALVGYDSANPQKSAVKRGFINVVHEDGHTEMAFWYYQKPPVKIRSDYKRPTPVSTEQRSSATAMIRPLRVVWFGSGAGSSVEALLHAQPLLQSFTVDAIFSDKNMSTLQTIGKQYGVPVLYKQYQEMEQIARTNGIVDQQMIDEIYFYAVTELLETTLNQNGETGAGFDLIVLCKFDRVLPPMFLARYNKVIKLHSADFRTIDPKTKIRKYTGPNAVYEAIKEGEDFTRSIVHGVTAAAHERPIVVVGPKVPWLGRDRYNDMEIMAHQERQKKLSDWPALIKAIDLISRGYKVGIDEPVILDD